MKQQFKYLTHSDEDEEWGFYLTVIGRAEIGAQEPYPPKGHPGGYRFSWETGRVLDEYQLLYITQEIGRAHV